MKNRFSEQRILTIPAAFFFQSGEKWLKNLLLRPSRDWLQFFEAANRRSGSSSPIPAVVTE